MVNYLNCLRKCSFSTEERAEVEAYASAIEEAGRKWDAQQAPAMAVDFATEAKPAESAGAWRTDAPPTDGTPIMAIGRVPCPFTDGGQMVPFSGVIYWPQDEEFADWRFLSGGMTVVEDAPGKLLISWWTTLPADYVGGAR